MDNYAISPGQAACKTRNITEPARMILSCLWRVNDHLGYFVGRTLLVQILRGSRDQRVLQLGLDSLSTYGLLANTPAPQVRAYIDYLEQQGYLLTDPQHSTLAPTRAASDVLFGRKKVEMPVPAEAPHPKKSASRRSDAAEPLPAETGGSLYDVLRAVRTQVAQAERVPVYMVFSNATLTDMAEKMPRTEEELLQVSGVGAAKVSRYGQPFLAAIAAHLDGQ